MRTRLALTLMTVALGTPSGADHLVGPQLSNARLEEASRQRNHDLASVGRLLESTDAGLVGAAFGADPDRVREGLATLSDAELRDLAARAQALAADPAAGSSERDVLVVVLIVLIVLLVLKAV